MIPVLVLAVVGAGAPCQDLPLLPGTTWTYRVQVSWTVEGSSTVRDTTMVWKTKVLASLRRDTTIVATVENWPTAAAWWEPKQAADTTLLACVGNRLYHLTRKQTASGAGTSPPEASGPLEPSINDLLLVFPLHEGMLYGQDPPDRTDSYYGWYVEQADPMPPSLKRLGADGGGLTLHPGLPNLPGPPDHRICPRAGDRSLHICPSWDCRHGRRTVDRRPHRPLGLHRRPHGRGAVRLRGRPSDCSLPCDVS